MTAARKVAGLALLASAMVGTSSGAHGQSLQPPPYEQSAPARAPAQPPPPAWTPPPARTPPPPPAWTPPPARTPPPVQPQVSRPPPQPGNDDTIDDPKVSRRLGTRISVPAPPPPPPAPVPQVRREPVAPLAPPPPSPAAPTEAEASGPPTVVRPYTPALEAPFQPTLPRLKIGLRRFDFVRIGASDSSDGVAAPETFTSLSVDVYPVSRGVRIGLSSAFGWQSGNFLVNGDYFATQTVSLGGQYRDLGRFVPFAEGFGGVGYMRRLQFERTIPTAFWQFGVDAGVEVYFARVGYLSFALGYLRPVNGFAKRQMFTSVFVDTWSFKVGIGI